MAIRSIGKVPESREVIKQLTATKGDAILRAVGMLEKGGFVPKDYSVLANRNRVPEPKLVAIAINSRDHSPFAMMIAKNALMADAIARNITKIALSDTDAAGESLQTQGWTDIVDGAGNGAIVGAGAGAGFGGAVGAGLGTGGGAVIGGILGTIVEPGGGTISGAGAGGVIGGGMAGAEGVIIGGGVGAIAGAVVGGIWAAIKELEKKDEDPKDEGEKDPASSSDEDAEGSGDGFRAEPGADHDCNDPFSGVWC